MVDAAVAGSAVLLWLLAATKAPTTIRSGSLSARWLLSSLALLALGISVLVPEVQLRLASGVGIDQVQEPLARTAVIGSAFCAQLALTYTTNKRLTQAALIRRVLYASVTVGTLWVTFAMGPTPPTARFGSHPVADLSMTVYILAFLAYLAYAIATVVHGTWRLARSSGDVVLRTSLSAIALGSACCLIYIAVKVLAIASFLAGRPVPGVLESALAQSCVALGAVLVAAGAGAVRLRERVAELRAWTLAWRHHRRLYRLWADLTAAVPLVALDPAVGPWRDAARLRDMHLRLYRRVIELRDAWLVLRPYMDGAEYLDAPQTTGRPAHSLAKGEAQRLRQAVMAQRQRRHPERRLGPGLPPVNSMEDELAWWSAVATEWDDEGTREPAPRHRAEAS